MEHVIILSDKISIFQFSFSFLFFVIKLYTSFFPCLFTKERWWEKLWKIPECIRGWDDQLKHHVPSQLTFQGGVTKSDQLF